MRSHQALRRQRRCTALCLFHTGIIAAILAAVLALSPSKPALAQSCDVYVENTNDSGVESLRQALIDVPSGGTICFGDLFQSPNTITLTSGALTITKSMTLNGPGRDYLIISGNDASRVFVIDPGLVVELHGVTIRNGYINPGDGGGGIRTASPLTLDGVALLDNSAPSNNANGGGILTSAALTITDSLVQGNYAYFTGGISSPSSSPTVIINSQILSNTTGSNTGGAHLNNLVMIDSLVQGNLGGGSVGGIYVGGNIQIENSRFIENSGATAGAFWLLSGPSNTVSVNNSYFERNSATYAAAALFGSAGSTYITNTQFLTNTISGNSTGTVDVDGNLSIHDSYIQGSIGGAWGVLGGGAVRSGKDLDIANTPILGSQSGGLAQILAGGNAFLSNVTVSDSNGGGGPVLSVTGDVTLDNATFTNNHSSTGVVSGVNITSTGSYFTDNAASGSSGGVITATGSLTVTANQFLSNTGGNATVGAGGSILISTGGNSELESVFANNQAANGAVQALGSLTIEDTLFDSNSATSGNGGAVQATGNVAITNAQFISNTTEADGGALYLDGGGTLKGVLLRNNSAYDDGGAISIRTGVYTIDASTFDGNSAGMGGGAIFNSGGTVSIVNATLHANKASFEGGGIYNGGTLQAQNVTLSGNTSYEAGNSIYTYGTGTTNLINTIAANSGGDDLAGAGSVTTNSVLTGAVTLGPLQNNGGDTPTMAPPTDSAAIDTGTLTGCPATDQRGMSRPQGLFCDIGAYEATDAALYDLMVDPALLTPAFTTTVTSYTSTVSNAVDSVRLTPTANVNNVVTVSVAQNGGAPVACSGTPVECPLAVGVNVVTTTVTAPDGTTKTYTVTVTRQSDATLNNLAINPGVLSPSFAPNTFGYTATVPTAVTDLTVTPTANPGDVVTVSVAQNGGAPVACSGTPVECPLAVGVNVVTTTVTAPDGTTKTYTITVTRASTPAIIDLTLQGGAGDISLTPTFTPTVTEYTALVDGDVSEITVEPVTDPGYTTMVSVAQNGGDPTVCSGSPITCPLAIGTNVVTVTVTGPDGVTKTYTITVTRAEQMLYYYLPIIVHDSTFGQ